MSDSGMRTVVAQIRVDPDDYTRCGSGCEGFKFTKRKEWFCGLFKAKIWKRGHYYRCAACLERDDE